MGGFWPAPLHQEASVMSRVNASEPAYSTPNREVVVPALGGFSSLAVVGDEHAFGIAEPKAFPGGNLGLNPFALILSARGGGAVGALQGVARQDGFELGPVEIRLRVKRNT